MRTPLHSNLSPLREMLELQLVEVDDFRIDHAHRSFLRLPSGIVQQPFHFVVPARVRALERR
jgi:hypothetical protein